MHISFFFLLAFGIQKFLPQGIQFFTTSINRIHIDATFLNIHRNNYLTRSQNLAEMIRNSMNLNNKPIEKDNYQLYIYNNSFSKIQINEDKLYILSLSQYLKKHSQTIVDEQRFYVGNFYIKNMMWNKLAVKRAKDFVIEESQKSTCFRHEFSSYPMIQSLNKNSLGIIYQLENLNKNLIYYQDVNKCDRQQNDLNVNLYDEIFIPDNGLLNNFDGLGETIVYSQVPDKYQFHTLIYQNNKWLSLDNNLLNEYHTQICSLNLFQMEFQQKINKFLIVVEIRKGIQYQIESNIYMLKSDDNVTKWSNNYNIEFYQFIQLIIQVKILEIFNEKLDPIMWEYSKGNKKFSKKTKIDVQVYQNQTALITFLNGESYQFIKKDDDFIIQKQNEYNENLGIPQGYIIQQIETTNHFRILLLMSTLDSSYQQALYVDIKDKSLYKIKTQYESLDNKIIKDFKIIQDQLGYKIIILNEDGIVYSIPINFVKDKIQIQMQNVIQKY